MDDDKFNMSLRKFLKQVGVTSQQQIERAVREAGVTGGRVPVKVVLSADEIVAAASGSTRSGIWGELLSTAARVYSPARSGS